MTVRVRNARGEGLRLRDELVDAATRLLESEDPAAVTLRGVARQAGVAAPSVYSHFADLDELLLSVVAHHLGDLRRALETAGPASLDDDPEDRRAEAVDRLRAAALVYCRWGLERPGAYAAVFGGRAVRLLSEQESAAFADGEAMLAHLGDLVAALPGVPTSDVPARVLATWTGLHGVVSLRTGKPGYPWPPLEDHVEVVLRDLLGDAAP